MAISNGLVKRMNETEEKKDEEISELRGRLEQSMMYKVEHSVLSKNQEIYANISEKFGTKGREGWDENV